MTIRATSIDYAGRQVDVELLQTVVDPQGTQEVLVSNVATQPKIVAGVQKSLQRYTLLLLTSLGDVHFALDEGSSLMPAFNSGQISNKNMLQYIFVLANTRVMQAIRASDGDVETFGSQPDDEKITSTELSAYDINYQTGVVTLTIKFTMASGSAITYLIPVATVR